MARWLLVYIIYINWWMIGNAEYMEGNVNLLNDDGFSFLGHWMFGHNPGNGTTDSWKLNEFKAGILYITLHLHKPLETATLFELALYDDQSSSWPSLYANKSNACIEHDNIYGINRTMAREYQLIEFISDIKDGNDTWSATINIHEHIIPRWWWVYLIKCDFDTTPTGDFIKNDIHYKLHWTQANTIKWNAEISLNEEFQNTLHCITPWLTLSLFIIECISYYLYWNKSIPKGFVHIIIKLLTLLMFLQFISQIFKMSYWLHLTFSGYKEFGILTFSFLFEISASIIFQYLLFSIFGFGWRMSISKLNIKLNYILIAISIFIEIFDFIIYIWSYQYYPNKETTLYRYNEDPQIVYGVFMLIFGIAFYIILLYGSCRDSLNGIITKIQRNFRILIGFCLLWSWFIWPIIAVAASETFANSRTDFVCDVISWSMKMLSFFMVIFVTHPINPYYDRCFDFSKQFIHARYVKNTLNDNVFHDDDDDDDDDDDADDNDAGIHHSEMQMNEIKKSTVFSTKFTKKKKKQKKKKGKLFKYGGRNQIGQDSDDDDDDDDDDSDDDSDDDDDDDDDDKKNNVSAISIDAAKQSENETLRSDNKGDGGS